MKISGQVYILIKNTFISWIHHWPPQQPQSEAGLSCKLGWRPPCQFWLLQPRSWHWGRPVCYEGVYWPLSQLRSTWNNLMDYNLLSWEARFPWTNGPSGWPSASPGWFWLCFGWLGHKIRYPCEAKWPFCVNFELRGQIFLDNGPSGWPSASPEWFLLCFGWPGHKIPCSCEAKRTFLC